MIQPRGTSFGSTPPGSKLQLCLQGSEGAPIIQGLKCKGERLSTSHARDRADQDLDNHFFDRFADELSKSTVWTAKALYAKEPCRSCSSLAPAQCGQVPSPLPGGFA